MKGHNNLRKGRRSIPNQIYHVSTATANWQPGFYDRAIRRDEDLERVARYIVANPLRAGIVRSVREYALWDAKWV